MGEYFLEQMVSEILSDKGDRASGISPDIYYGAWEALNKWIEVKISKRKGADVPLLGTFTWEKINDQVSRPIFIINENFVKLHRIRRPRKFTEPITTGSEDANYSQLAIKYSKKLTKDMMFIGIRDIVRKIGDYVDRMVEFEIPFSIGMLRSRQRKVKFEFNLGRLASILPETLLQADSLPEMVNGSGGGAVPETARSTLSTMSTYSVDPTPRERETPREKRVPSLNFGKDVRPMYTGNKIDNSGISTLATTEEFPDILDEYTGTDSGNGITESEKDYNGQFNNSGKLEKPVSPRMQEMLVDALEFDQSIPLGSTYGEKQDIKKGRKLNACNMVQEQAFLRCLDNVAVGANYEDKWQMQSKEIRDAQMAEEKVFQEKRQKEKRASQELLKQQIQSCRENSKKAELERKLADFKFHIGGEKSGYVDDVLGNGKHMDKTQIKKLEMQIQENKLRREYSKQSKRKEEKEYLDHVAMEIDMKNVSDHIEHLEKQQLLLSSWERDGHLRNLKRLQEQGARSVHRYINENVAEEIDPEILSRTKTSAIGFDSRSGRK